MDLDNVTKRKWPPRIEPVHLRTKWPQKAETFIITLGKAPSEREKTKDIVFLTSPNK